MTKFGKNSKQSFNRSNGLKLDNVLKIFSNLLKSKDFWIRMLFILTLPPSVGCDPSQCQVLNKVNNGCFRVVKG